MKKSITRSLVLLLLVLLVPMLSCGDSSSIGNDSPDSSTIPLVTDENNNSSTDNDPVNNPLINPDINATAEISQEQLDNLKAAVPADVLSAVYAVLKDVPWGDVAGNLLYADKNKTADSSLTKGAYGIVLLNDETVGLRVVLNILELRVYIEFEGFTLVLGAGIYGTVVAQVDISTLLYDGYLRVDLFTEDGAPLHMTKEWDEEVGLIDLPLDVTVGVCVNVGHVIENIWELEINPLSLCGLTGEVVVLIALPSVGVELPITVPLFTEEEAICGDNLASVVDMISCGDLGLAYVPCLAFKTFFEEVIGVLCSF